MNITSLVLRIRPETRAEAEAALRALPGVECHHMSDDGKLIVTVEDAPGAAMSDTLIAVHRVPQVLAATLAYEHCDNAVPITPIPTPRNLPCQEAQP
ncbi:chaperone NapD [Propionivibrio sp.]|jgi:nitrate reductase NapD|uniref:chaperone NapD n=1 Tax=Propionivibrio sp. TaxID=2212460 RepID=UPI00272DD401|nr:chaperone NapD [Propionivibrio sp.]